eukprot:m.296314 g.296314  ORF g.296314 m.296314 type:complete len:439 (-) comp22976_c1_seq4:539-1855(-)
MGRRRPGGSGWDSLQPPSQCVPQLGQCSMAPTVGPHAPRECAKGSGSQLFVSVSRTAPFICFAPRHGRCAQHHPVSFQRMRRQHCLFHAHALPPRIFAWCAGGAVHSGAADGGGCCQRREHATQPGAPARGHVGHISRAVGAAAALSVARGSGAAGHSTASGRSCGPTGVRPRGVRAAGLPGLCNSAPGVDSHCCLWRWHGQEGASHESHSRQHTGAHSTGQVRLQPSDCSLSRGGARHALRSRVRAGFGAAGRSARCFGPSAPGSHCWPHPRSRLERHLCLVGPEHFTPKPFTPHGRGGPRGCLPAVRPGFLADGRDGIGGSGDSGRYGAYLCVDDFGYAGWAGGVQSARRKGKGSLHCRPQPIDDAALQRQYSQRVAGFRFLLGRGGRGLASAGLDSAHADYATIAAALSSQHHSATGAGGTREGPALLTPGGTCE